MNTAIATIGHNQPPLTPYESAMAEIDELYKEAALWLDGKDVADQATADGLGKLLNMIRDARKRADEARKIENDPFDKGKAEVQARYNPLLKKADLATDTCKKVLAPWLEKLEAEKRAIALKARQDADEKTRLAQEAFRDSDVTDLAKREDAERLLDEAKKAEKIATKTRNDTAKASGGTGRSISLRTIYSAVLTDPTTTARHYWNTRRTAFEGFLQGLADEDCRNGRHIIPGVTITETKTAV